MTTTTAPVEPIVVGVDGSSSGEYAAIWAAKEATGRNTVLRLVYVAEDDNADIEQTMSTARSALHHAWEAVTDTGAAVKLESEIVFGRPVDCLVAASRGASMVCVGAGDGLGATPAALAKQAQGPVAVIRRRSSEPVDPRKWIVVALDETGSALDALEAAMHEATLRDAPVLVLESWSHVPRTDAGETDRHPVRSALEEYLTGPGATDTQVCTLSMPTHLLHLLRQSVSIDQLLVVAADQQALVEELTGARAREILRGTDCSLLFIR
jgi:nucleotide-binding universal stress UspA family protein